MCCTCAATLPRPVYEWTSKEITKPLVIVAVAKVHPTHAETGVLSSWPRQMTTRTTIWTASAMTTLGTGLNGTFRRWWTMWSVYGWRAASVCSEMRGNRTYRTWPLHLDDRLRVSASSRYYPWRVSFGIWATGCVCLLENARQSCTPDFVRCLRMSGCPFRYCPWRVSFGIWVVTGCVCLLGVAGNVVSFVVLKRAFGEQSPMFHVLRAMSVSDSVFLLAVRRRHRLRYGLEERARVLPRNRTFKTETETKANILASRPTKIEILSSKTKTEILASRPSRNILSLGTAIETEKKTLRSRPGWLQQRSVVPAGCDVGSTTCWPSSRSSRLSTRRSISDCSMSPTTSAVTSSMPAVKWNATVYFFT